MDDEASAKRWHVELKLRTAEKAIELQMKKRLVIVAVSLTIGGSAAIAWATETVGSMVTLAIGVACAIALLEQFRALRILEHKHEAAALEALMDADRLMNPGGEP